MVEVTVHQVAYDVFSGSPLVILRSRGNEAEYMPVWVGYQEAIAIMVKVLGGELDRPLTPDLIRDIIAALQGRVTGAQIHALREGVYISRLVVERDGNEVELDARPSDMIAIALRTDTPIEVDDEVFEQCKVMLSGDEDWPEVGAADEDWSEMKPEANEEETVDTEKQIAEFREFLRNATPEDFHKGS